MKKTIILILMISASNVMATDCGDISLNSVGDDTSDGSDNNTAPAPNSFLSNSDTQINCTPVALSPIRVVGYFMPSFGGLSSLSWALSLPSGSGGGGGAVAVSEADENFGCGAGSTPDHRMREAAIIFNAEYGLKRIEALSPIFGQEARLWLASHRADQTYEMIWPNGTVGRYRISGPMMSEPLTAELSCN